jgi:hypothetical protein
MRYEKDPSILLINARIFGATESLPTSLWKVSPLPVDMYPPPIPRLANPL